MRSRWTSGMLAITFAALLQAGCGKSNGPERVEVSGQVTYRGEAIADGEISFQPVAGSPGPPTSGSIQNGQYKLGQDWGVVPGTYQVLIRAYRSPPPNDSNLIQPGVTLDRPPETPGIPRREQFLPDKFHAQSTIEKLVVTSGQKKIEKNYDLKD